MQLVVQPGQKAWKEIQKAFGDEVFSEDGQLNREALGKIIFSDVNKRKELNKITHPKIQRMMFWAVIKHFFEGSSLLSLLISFILIHSSKSNFYEGHKFVVLDIPLLFETGTLLPFIHKIITVSW